VERPSSEGALDLALLLPRLEQDHTRHTKMKQGSVKRAAQGVRYCADLTNVLLKLFWDHWLKTPGETCSAKQRCVSLQWFYSVVISSKLIRGAAAAVVTSPVNRGAKDRQDKKPVTTFCKPGRYSICTLNSEMNAKWLVDVAKWGL
jgi:hypothetical protein